MGLGPECRIMWDVTYTKSNGTQGSIPIEAENADEAKEKAMEHKEVVDVVACEPRIEET